MDCLADETTFNVKAKAIESDDFRPLSTATACGVARVYVGHQGLDAFHWCRDVTVLPVGVDLED